MENSTGIQSPRLNVRSGYMPTLDGWRAVAILSVIMCHDTIHRVGIFSTKWLYYYGDRGVDVFFAISGILICSRLLIEEDKNGSISLRRFYLRRAFRILPPATIYLFVVIILGLAGYLIVRKSEIFAAIFFYRNYTRLLGGIKITDAAFTGHFWSLSLEEHFYLLLPSLLVFTRKKFRIPLMASLVAIVIANRAYQLTSRAWPTIRWHTDVRLDALLIPAIIAILVHQFRDRVALLRVAKWWPGILVLAVMIIPRWEGNFLKPTLLALLLSLVIMGSVLYPENILGRLLEKPALRYIGRISYSLYLWQQIFVTAAFYPSKPLGVLEKWPINIAATFGCAIASYYLIEIPAIKLGHRITAPVTSGRNDVLDASLLPEGK